MGFKKWLIAVIMLSIVLLPGCWDIEEVGVRSIPNALFLDKGNPEQVKLGAVYFVPGTLLPPIIGTTQQFQKRNFVLSAEGRDLTDAWDKLQAVTARSVFFGQLRAIVISDEFARMNINNFLDFIGRMPGMPLNIPILVTKSDPEKLLDIKSKANIIPGNYINLHLESPHTKPQAIPGALWQVFAALDNKTFDPFMPLIEEDQNNYRIAGMAVFSGPRMTGELNMEETKTAALIKEVPNGLLTIPLENGGSASFRNLSSGTTITPGIDDKGVLTFRIQMNVQGEISELNPRKQEVTQQEKKKLELQAAATIKKNTADLMVKLQRLDSDPLGFGEKFRAAYPHLWEKINWHKVYAAARFDVEAKFKIIQTGMSR